MEVCSLRWWLVPRWLRRGLRHAICAISLLCTRSLIIRRCILCILWLWHWARGLHWRCWTSVSRAWLWSVALT